MCEALIEEPPEVYGISIPSRPAGAAYRPSSRRVPPPKSPVRLPPQVDRVDELVASTRPEISHGSSNLISSGARVGLATALAGAANYASNIVLGRALDEDAFADAALTVSGLLLFAAIALGFQMTTAKTIASGGGATAIRAALWKARRTGVLVGAALLAAAAPLSDLTGMGSSWPLILLAVSVPLLFDLAVRRGAVQASNRFSTLAFSLLIEGVLRLIMTAVALLAGLSATSAGAGIIVSLIVSSAACGPSPQSRWR